LYNIPRAQFVICDLPYNLGNAAFASNPEWYVDGDNSKGESDKAGKSFFHTDENFNLVEYFHFCGDLLKKEPKPSKKVEGEKRKGSDAPCMIVFCAFQQMAMLIETAAKYGLNHYINLVFRKNYSAQVLKANMRIVGNCEYAVLLYRNKLPKFNNAGRMIFNCLDWKKDTETPKIHPTQKPVNVLRYLIEVFTDKGDVVIDPVAGSGTTLLAAMQCGRRAYGFEIKKNFYRDAQEKILKNVQTRIFA
jgi:site-specific DNA-methyltransferase (adenine-specific)